MVLVGTISQRWFGAPNTGGIYRVKDLLSQLGTFSKDSETQKKESKIGCPK